MTQAALVSKVLVLDSDEGSYDHIKRFCEENQLIGLRVSPDNVMGVLRSNVDLGGILLSENYNNDLRGGLLMAKKIHVLRPELPIFLRRTASDTLGDLSAEDQNSLSAAFTIEKIDSLKGVLDEYIFSISYPNALLRGIAEITKAALESQLKGLRVDVEAPYIVRDKLIYGEIFTLIPIESNWCRGYMTLQTDEFALLQMAVAEKTHLSAREARDFRNLNAVLGEITNLVWGAFKNRYMGSIDRSNYVSQVPIVINHLHRYISFGSENPQLCFKYVVGDPDDGQSMDFYQKFVFNLSWSPEDFSETEVSVEALVEAGELEMF